MIPISKPQLGPEEEAAVIEVLRSGQLAQGPQVAEFEEAFAKAVGALYAVAVGNGTQALHLALLAHGIGPGDQVITTPFTFVSTAGTILMCGARPVFVDVEEETGNIDITKAGNVIGAQLPRPKALLPVHLYGHPCDIAAVDAFRAFQFPCETEPMWADGIVVYDACQAHGATVDGRRIGAFGTSCWSFYATKNVTTGEGGAVTTNDPAVAHRLRLLRNHGQVERYRYERLGYNCRMTEMQAAIGLVQLEKLRRFTFARRGNAQFLTTNLQDAAKTGRIALPSVRKGCKHAWHQYTIRVHGDCYGARDALAQHLRDNGIGTGVYYPRPLHLQPTFAHLGYGVGDFPVAERLAGQVLSLPVHPGLEQADLEWIVEAVNGWAAG